MCVSINTIKKIKADIKEKARHVTVKWGYFMGGLLKDCENHGKPSLTVNGDAEQSY